jgi:hypothetical protein
MRCVNRLTVVLCLEVPLWHSPRLARHHGTPGGPRRVLVSRAPDRYFLHVSRPSRQSIKKVAQYSDTAEVERIRNADSCVLVQ